MSKILELREKRAKAWEAAKAYLDSKRGGDGLLSAEDTAAYEKMEGDVVALGREIERLERQAALDAELSQPTNNPITNKPSAYGEARAAGPPPSTSAPSGTPCAASAPPISKTRCR